MASADTAKCSGVRPCTSLALASAPPSRSFLNPSTLPCLAARWRGVSPWRSVRAEWFAPLASRLSTFPRKKTTFRRSSRKYYKLAKMAKYLFLISEVIDMGGLNRRSIPNINAGIRITQDKFQYHGVEIWLTFRAYTLHQKHPTHQHFCTILVINADTMLSVSLQLSSMVPQLFSKQVFQLMVFISTYSKISVFKL